MPGLIASGPELGTYTPPQLFAGDGAIRTKVGSFATSLTLVANTVIARNTTTGKLVAWDPAGSTGVNIAVGITTEAIDTTGGADTKPYYISGDFNIAALVWPTATDAQKEMAFDRTPITVRTLAG